MIHEMRLNNEPFNKIKEGTKTVELRLLDEKRKTLRVGDKIIFTNRTNNEKIDVVITNLFKADSFEPIYENILKLLWVIMKKMKLSQKIWKNITQKKKLKNMVVLLLK